MEQTKWGVEPERPWTIVALLCRSVPQVCHVRIIKTEGIYNLLFIMVPGTGIEPVQPFSRGILSPLCLPISPPGQLEAGVGIEPA